MSYEAGLVAPDRLAVEIRDGLQNLASGFDQMKSAAYTKAVLSYLFYDIEKALACGATQRAVHKLIVDHGVPLPYTRFLQDMARLRAALLPYIHEPALDVKLVSTVAASISDLGHRPVVKQLPIAPSPALMPDIPAGVGQRSGRRQTEVQVPAVERVRLCARAVLDVAQAVETDPDAISARMRLALGPGWSIQAVFQFVVGSIYAEWMNAPWQSKEEALDIQCARRLALSVVSHAKKVPEKTYLMKAVREAWLRLNQRVHDRIASE